MSILGLFNCNGKVDLFVCRWNFTVGDVHLMLIEGEESTGHSCNLFQELKWELRVDTLTGMIYAADRYKNTL